MTFFDFGYLFFDIPNIQCSPFGTISVNHPVILINVQLCVSYPHCKQTGYYAHARTSAAQKARNLRLENLPAFRPKGQGILLRLRNNFAVIFMQNLYRLIHYEIFEHISSSTSTFWKLMCHPGKCDMMLKIISSYNVDREAE
jgi:hypothetical protein